MNTVDIVVGKTYFGTRDFKRGVGTHRTVIANDGSIVTFRNEVGPTPPDSYVELANMGAGEFATWAEKAVATPKRPKPR